MELNARKIILILVITGIILVILNFFPAEWCSSFLPAKWCIAFQNQFNLDLEANIPTWFATLLLFATSLTSYLIYALEHKKNSGTALSSFWLAFSCIFCFLSLDEASGLHEMVTSALNIEWLWIYAPMGVIFFIICAYFFEYVIKKKELTDWILGGMIIYALGVIVSEIAGSYISLGKAGFAIEEGFEMLGSIMVLTGCLNGLNLHLRSK